MDSTRPPLPSPPVKSTICLCLCGTENSIKGTFLICPGSDLTTVDRRGGQASSVSTYHRRGANAQEGYAGKKAGGQKGTETSLNSQLHNKKATSKQSADVPAVPAQNLSLFHVF